MSSLLPNLQQPAPTPPTLPTPQWCNNDESLASTKRTNGEQYTILFTTCMKIVLANPGAGTNIQNFCLSIYFQLVSMNYGK
jgi:hypothetical protein